MNRREMEIELLETIERVKKDMKRMSAEAYYRRKQEIKEEIEKKKREEVKEVINLIFRRRVGYTELEK